MFTDFFYFQLLRSLKENNQINLSKLDKKTLRIIQTKFGNHPLVEEMFNFFSIFSFVDPYKRPIEII
jgi:hypothetical protein